MKLLAHLEKTKLIWWLIALCLFFFFLRLPSVIEPYWYGDEGIYEVIGQAMNHGSLLYHDIWDNKPPLLYVVYAFAQGDQPTVKILSLLIGVFSLITFFFFTQKLFRKPYISIALTFLYALLLGTPILEGNIANAEDFILFPILLAGLLIYTIANSPQNKKNNSQHSSIFTLHSLHFIAGLLLGIAFLFKIVAFFDLVAFLLFIIFIQLPKKPSWQVIKTLLHQEKSIYFLLLGFVIPFLVTTLYFTLNNGLNDFFQSAFFGNVDYVGWQNNFLGIPQGLLVIKIILLMVSIGIIFWKRNRFTKPVLFITLWLTFSLFNAYFSGRPYTHYAIVVLPSFCFFIGLFLISRNSKKSIALVSAILVIIVALNLQFNFNMPKSYAYYQNVIQFVSGQKNVADYQSFFDQKVPRDYALALFIRNNTKPSDTIYIWGNNPQIYVLSHKLPPTKHIVAYHVAQNNAFQQTQQTLNTVKPKYIVVLKESQPLPFSLPLYIMRYSVSGAVVYERSL